MIKKKSPFKFEGSPESPVAKAEVGLMQVTLVEAVHAILSGLDIARGMPRPLLGPDGEIILENVSIVIPPEGLISERQLAIAKRILGILR